MAAEGGCVWLYAVAANDAGTGTRIVTGVAGELVRAVRTAGLTAFVGGRADRPEHGTGISVR